MKRLRILLAAGVLLAAGAADGQITPTQDGRALDANFLIGSGGINSLDRRNYIVDGNLYVTGEVTLGRHFRGDVPYAGADQFRMDLPSAGLDDFRRDSFGADRLGRGSPYGPATYLSPFRTVLGVAGIVDRSNLPGSTVPRETYIPPAQTRRLYDSAMEAYKPILPDMGRLLEVKAMVTGQGSYAPAGAGPEADTSARWPGGITRPSASTLFGVLREQDKQRLTEELTEAEIIRRRRTVGEPLEAQVKTDQQEQPPTEPATGAVEGDRLMPPAPQTGGDVYTDLLRAIIEMQRQAAEATAADRQPPKIEKPQRQPLPFEDQTEPRLPPTRFQAVRPVEKVDDRLVLRRLAGTGSDLFNLHMNKAELLLSEGKFYDAAGQYRLAGIFDPSNPLAPLGASLALFGANEPVSAALELRQAMILSRLLMATGVDVAEIIGKDVVELRIQQLQQRIDTDGPAVEPSLVFLAAFVRSALGQADKAMALAQKLRTLSGADRVIKAYAEYLLKANKAQPSATPPPAPPKPD